MSIENIEPLRTHNVGGGKRTLILIPVSKLVSIPDADPDGVIRDPLVLIADAEPVEDSMTHETVHFKTSPEKKKGIKYHRTRLDASIPKDSAIMRARKEYLIRSRVVIIYSDNNGNSWLIGSKSNPVEVDLNTDHKRLFNTRNENVFSIDHLSRIAPYPIVFSYENGSGSTDSSAYLPEAEVYFEAMEDAGDALSDAEKTNWNTLVAARILNNTWYDRLAIYPVKGKTIEGMRINARNPGTYDLDETGSWKTSKWGLIKDDALSTTYLKTGITPSLQLSENNVSVGYYLDQTGSYGHVFGAYESATKSLLSEITATHDFHVCSATDKISITKDEDHGLWECSRTGLDELLAHRDASFATPNTTSETSDLPAQELIIGGYNNNGTLTGTWGKGDGFRWFEIGGKKTQAQMTQDKAILFTWLKSQDRLLHPSLYGAFDTESNTDRIEMQARSNLVQVIDDLGHHSDLKFLYPTYAQSASSVEVESIDPSRSLSITGTGTKKRYYGLDGLMAGTDKIDSSINLSTEITNIDDFTLCFYLGKHPTAVGVNDIFGGDDGSSSFVIRYDETAGQMQLVHDGGVINMNLSDIRGVHVVNIEDEDIKYLHKGVEIGAGNSAGDAFPNLNAFIHCSNQSATAVNYSDPNLGLLLGIDARLTTTEAQSVSTAVDDYFNAIGKNFGVDSNLRSMVEAWNDSALYFTTTDYLIKKRFTELDQYSNYNLLYCMMTENGSEPLALKNIAPTYAAHNATKTGTVTFDLKGSKGNGASGVLDLNFTPTPDMILPADQVAMSVFLSEQYSTPSGYLFGCSDGGGSFFMSLEVLSSKEVRVRLSEGANNNDVILPNNSGLITIKRMNFNTLEVLHNGNIVATFNTIVNGPPDESLVLHAFNNGAVSGYTSAIIGGFALTPPTIDFSSIYLAFLEVENITKGWA